MIDQNYQTQDFYFQIEQPQKQLYEYLLNHKWENDHEYELMKSFLVMIKECMFYHAKNFSIHGLTQSTDTYNHVVTHIRNNLKIVREINHSLQEEFEKHSFSCSRSISVISGLSGQSNKYQKPIIKSSLISETTQIFTDNFKDTEYLVEQIQSLIPLYELSLLKITEEEFQLTPPAREKNANKWIENLFFEIKCLKNELQNIVDLNSKHNAQQRLDRVENGELLQLLFSIHYNFIGVKQCLSQLTQVIEDLIELDIKQYKGKVNMEKLIDFSSHTKQKHQEQSKASTISGDCFEIKRQQGMQDDTTEKFLPKPTQRPERFYKNMLPYNQPDIVQNSYNVVSQGGCCNFF